MLPELVMEAAGRMTRSANAIDAVLELVDEAMLPDIAALRGWLGGPAG